MAKGPDIRPHREVVGSDGPPGHGRGPVPPLRSRQVSGAQSRVGYYLPWVVGLVGLILLVLLFRSYVHEADERTATTTGPSPMQTDPAVILPSAIEDVPLPGRQTVSVERSGLNAEVQHYLASSEPAPRTFTFDKLNFDTGSAAIRPTEQESVATLAQILNAYPTARVEIIGYTDARGSAATNAKLGTERARSVVAALTARGVGKGRITARWGGEGNPAAANATGAGQFENRLTELVVSAK